MEKTKKTKEKGGSIADTIKDIKKRFGNDSIMKLDQKVVTGLDSLPTGSYAAIAWLLGYLKTQNTWVFIWYRLVFGGVILAAITAGILQNV